MNPVFGTDATAAPSATHGVYWLKRDRKTMRTLRLVKWGSYLLPVAVVILLASMYFLLGMDEPQTLSPEKKAKLAELMTVSAVLIVALAGLPVIVAMALTHMRRELGTDGYRIYVRLTDGSQLSFPPERAVYNARQIRFESLVVALRTGHGQPLYAEGEVESRIAPLLGRAQKLGLLAMTRYELAHPDRLMIVLLVYVALLVALIVATGIWK